MRELHIGSRSVPPLPLDLSRSEWSSGFGSTPYGIDVPLVKPYIHWHVTTRRLRRRPLRADARRNRERVLEAARAVFAEHGRDAQMDDVARRAGVGVGTVYRHFPTKEALIEALMARALRDDRRARPQAALDDRGPVGGVRERAVGAAPSRMAADRALTRGRSRASPAPMSRCRPSTGSTATIDAS